MMDNKDRLLKAMHDIKNAGFSISVDDFGSGFSSLSLLKDIPANVVAAGNPCIVVNYFDEDKIKDIEQYFK